MGGKPCRLAEHAGQCTRNCIQLKLTGSRLSSSVWVLLQIHLLTMASQLLALLDLQLILHRSRPTQLAFTHQYAEYRNALFSHLTNVIDHTLRWPPQPKQPYWRYQWPTLRRTCILRRSTVH
jgi:hypothetical protein